MIFFSLLNKRAEVIQKRNENIENFNYTILVDSFANRMLFVAVPIGNLEK
jgi:hypothetical protein